MYISGLQYIQVYICYRWIENEIISYISYPIIQEAQKQSINNITIHVLILFFHIILIIKSIFVYVLRKRQKPYHTKCWWHHGVLHTSIWRDRTSSAMLRPSMHDVLPTWIQTIQILNMAVSHALHSMCSRYIALDADTGLNNNLT